MPRSLIQMECLPEREGNKILWLSERVKEPGRLQVTEYSDICVSRQRDIGVPRRREFRRREKLSYAH